MADGGEENENIKSMPSSPPVAAAAQPPPQSPVVAGGGGGAGITLFKSSPILRALHRDNDFVGAAAGANSDSSNSGSRKKRSVRDCLRYKSLPRPEVRRVLSTSSNNTNDGGNNGASEDNPITWRDLHLSNLSLLSSLGSLKRQAIASIDGINSSSSNSTACDKDAQDTADPLLRSSLGYVSRLATAASFLQLLLEYRPAAAPEENPQLAAAAAATAEADRNKMVLQLVKGLVGFSCSCLERYNEKRKEEAANAAEGDGDSNDSIPAIIDGDELYTGDASVSFNVHRIALFVFGSLLRIDHYVRLRPFLLSPLWKGLCEIVVAASAAGNGTRASGGFARLLPTGVLRDTIRSLADYLKEGTEPTLLNCRAMLENPSAGGANGSNNNNAFQVKILGFLVARTAVFLPMLASSNNDKDAAADESSPSADVAQMLSVLSLLRGIATAVESSQQANSSSSNNSVVPTSAPSSLLQPYHQLAAKVEKCVMSSIFGDNNGPAVDDSSAGLSTRILKLLLRTRPLRAWEATATTTNNGNTNLLALQSFAIGKTQLLLQVLRRVNDTAAAEQEQRRPWSEPDVESILLTCQCLLFDSLPASVNESVMAPMNNTNESAALGTAATELLQRSVRVAGQTLLLCELTTQAPSISTNAQPGRGGFHRLLVSWLAPPATGSYHPLAIELSMSTLHLHVLGLLRSDELLPSHSKEEDASASSSAVMPLLSLCVDLLFHALTTTPFRSNIACFVVRLLRDSATRDNIESLLVPEITKIFEQLREDVAAANHNRKSIRSRKRKRTSSTRRLGLGDTRVIGWLASHLRCPLPSLVHDVPWAGGRVLRSKELAYASFRIDIETASLRSGHQGSKDHVCSLIKLWNYTAIQRRSRRAPELSLWLGTSLFRYLGSVCDKVSDQSFSSDALIQVCRLLSQTLSKDIESSDSAYEAIGVLGSVGKIIRPNCPDPVLQDLSSVFRQLLSSRHWPIRSHALSAFVSFSSTIPGAYKSMLPSCLPAEMRIPLQCRLQNSLGAAAAESLAVAWSTCSRMLVRKSSRRPWTGKIFPVSNSFSIPSGSFFMTMPTQAGRNAVVIFPPGEQSIEDIKYMLGINEEDEEPKVQTIHRAVALNGGSCCKLLLQD